MTTVMNVILMRVLSQELARQEVWQKEDIETFGEELGDRSGIINEIKQFMADNDIKFSQDQYLNEILQLG